MARAPGRQYTIGVSLVLGTDVYEQIESLVALTATSDASIGALTRSEVIRRCLAAGLPRVTRDIQREGARTAKR